jgi:hypothetical protein
MYCRVFLCDAAMAQGRQDGQNKMLQRNNYLISRTAQFIRIVRQLHAIRLQQSLLQTKISIRCRRDQFKTSSEKQPSNENAALQ